MKKESLYVFLHNPKTAGTTLAYHLEKNFKRAEILLLSYKVLGLKKDERDYSKILKKTEKFILDLGKDKREKIKIVYGHIVPWGVDKFFERDAKYFTFVRHPADRAVSSYNYLVTLYKRERDSGKDKKIYTRGLLVNGKLPNFYTWYRKKWDKEEFGLTSTSQYKFFQFLGYLEPGDVTEKSVEDMLEKFYFTGTTETFLEDSLFLYEKLGIERFFVRRNISENYFRPKEKKKMEKIVNKTSPGDFIIFNKAKVKQQAFAKSSEYLKLVDKARNKRKVLLWFHQITYDFRHSLGMVSSLLRRVMPFYGKLLDKIKENYK